MAVFYAPPQKSVRNLSSGILLAIYLDMYYHIYDAVVVKYQHTYSFYNTGLVSAISLAELFYIIHIKQ